MTTCLQRGRELSAAFRRFFLRVLSTFTLALLLAPATGCGAEARTQFRNAGPGLAYRNDRVLHVPWSIHVIRVDRAQADLELDTSLARGTVLGLSTLANQIKDLPAELGRPVAGINGDFYVVDRGPYVGDPRGLQISFGELISGPVDQPCFWLDAEGQPHLTNVVSQFHVTWPNGTVMRFSLNDQRRSGEAALYTPRLGERTRTVGGPELVLERAEDGPWLPLRAGQTYRARVRAVRENGDTPLANDIMVLSLGSQLAATTPEVAPGDVVKISTVTVPDLSAARTAIGGGPVLVRDGKPVPITIPPNLRGALPYQYKSMTERHPRSSVGWNKTHLFLVQVDGRQPGLSMGMTVSELSEYFVKLGCTEAMNLDGGASSTIWLNGMVVNSPCHGQDRSIANALVVLRKSNHRND
jgi:hypothetical protein